MESYDANTFERYIASNGAEIFRLPLRAFPNFIVYAFLIALDGQYILVDTGSGLGHSDADLEAGFARIREMYHHDVEYATLDQIIISHAHIDHQGGLPAIKAKAPLVTVTAHELSIPALVVYDEFRTMLSHRLYSFLRRSGVDAERREKYLELYNQTRGEYQDTPIEYTFRDGDVLFDAIEVIHTPGHAPGLAMLRVGDILISTDAFLPETSVTLWPECVFPSSGISLYLDAIERATRIEGIRLALGSHERAMPDYYEVVGGVRKLAIEKIERVYDLLKEPRTILEVTKLIYPDMSKIPLLKVVQTGARAEYLNQRGLIVLDNLEDLKEKPGLPHRFRVR